MNHHIPLMKLIEDIPIQNQELKTKASILLDDLEKFENELKIFKVEYKTISEKSSNHLIFEDTE